MECRYCGTKIGAGKTLCNNCGKLRQYYKRFTKSSKGNYTLYAQVKRARTEYELLTLPNPPVDLIRMYNNDAWPMSLSYVKCEECGRDDLIGRSYVHCNKIYCAECTEALALY